MNQPNVTGYVCRGVAEAANGKWLVTLVPVLVDGERRPGEAENVQLELSRQEADAYELGRWYDSSFQPMEPPPED